MIVTIKLENKLEETVDNLCEKYRTTAPDLFRAYVVWLAMNNIPKGYPRKVVQSKHATPEDYADENTMILNPGENIKFPAILAEELLEIVNNE
jgi:stringent starvation protein B